MSYLDEFFDQRKKQVRLTAEQQRVAETKRLEEQRQKVIAFKKYFGTHEGREVMTDLMDKFYLSAPDTESAVVLARAQGRRDVVAYVLKQAMVNMDDLDKILRGEFV